jgi:hopanoid C-3 methylase
MRIVLVHPGPLMYSEIYLRLEPLGLERVAAALRGAGHDVRLLDLQIFQSGDLFAELRSFKPHAVGFSLNYLANVPEVIDLAREAKWLLPGSFVFVGGHSASFTAEEILDHAHGAIDCVVRGEGEAIAPRLIEAMGDRALQTLPGVVTRTGAGPSPTLLDSLDRHLPARDLTRRRQRYFIGVLDPCASVEFTRGCPWDCVFCSAWTFYGRTYRKASPEAIGEDLASIREPNVFIVDDVAFIQSEHGMAIGREIERRGIQKQYYLETRCDVLIKNREVFAYWRRLGLRYMFLGLEALDEEGLSLHRKRVSPGENFKALEIARSLDLIVAVNIIADPDWDERRFAVIREWASTVPEIVHLTVNTPYPGTETWQTEARRFTTLDYRLFDIQHAVLPTRMPLERFYEELVRTQAVLNRRHLSVASLSGTARHAARLLMRGQTNFLQSIWKFSRVYNAGRQLADHERPVRYALRRPAIPARVDRAHREQLYVHVPVRRAASA